MHIRGYKTIKSKFSYAIEFQQFLVQMPDFPLIGKINKKSCLNQQTCILVNLTSVTQCQRVTPQVKAVLLIGTQVWQGIFGIRDSGFDQNTVRDSGKRELYHILTDKGTLQIPGKRDSPKFKRGMRDFFYLNVGNSGERTFERQIRITQQRVECALLDFFMLLFLVTREEFGIFAGKGAVMRDQGPLQIDYLHK